MLEKPRMMAAAVAVVADWKATLSLEIAKETD